MPINVGFCKDCVFWRNLTQSEAEFLNEGGNAFEAHGVCLKTYVYAAPNEQELENSLRDFAFDNLCEEFEDDDMEFDPDHDPEHEQMLRDRIAEYAQDENQRRWAIQRHRMGYISRSKAFSLPDNNEATSRLVTHERFGCLQFHFSWSRARERS